MKQKRNQENEAKYPDIVLDICPSSCKFLKLWSDKRHIEEE